MTDRPPLCFVLMPFGTKPDENGRRIDFDAVYTSVIRPAVEDAGLECVRADEEEVGGIIHKPMFERLFLCDYAVADLTTANANVFYELGIRHALRPHTTVLVSAAGSRLPFDLEPVRVQLQYTLTEQGRPASSPKDADKLRSVLTATQRRAPERPDGDSPVYQLIGDILEAPPQRPKTGQLHAFKDRLATEAERRDRIARAVRAKDDEALGAVEQELARAGALGPAEARNLLLAYRAIERYDLMISLVTRLPGSLRAATAIREQYGLALNREGEGREAEDVLRTLIDEIGPNGETCGILARVYKDEWARATDPDERRVLLDQAIETYLRGFEADWRDYYPGLNALELMTVRNPDDPQIARLLTVVEYSAERIAASGARDYWIFATLFELAVMRGDMDRAQRWLDDALKTRPDAMSLRGTRESLSRLRAAETERPGRDDTRLARLRAFESQLAKRL